MMFRLRDITPRGLYARSLSMLLVPLLAILSLMTWYYYDSHIAEVNRKLAQAIGRDAIVVKSYCEQAPDNPGAKAFLQDSLDFAFACNIEEAEAFPETAVKSFAYVSGLRRELQTLLGTDVDIALVKPISMLDIRFPAETGTVQMVLERKRAFAINSHIFIVWVIIFSLGFVLLAVAFLNQQVRSIIRLSNAAKAFGRGRDVPDFRPSGATEVREAARSVIDMKNRLTAFAAQRTSMLAAVSHDLRTPLTRLKLALAMMEQTEDIEAARRDLDDMSKMLNEYLAFASGEEGEEPETFDIAQMCRTIAAEFGPHVGVIAPRETLLKGRPLALKRAITNLISNAVKYGGTVKVSLTAGPRAVDILVDDDGPGIPPDQHEDAFRPFSRLEVARTQNTSGTGLGLTLARDTARSHGGDLRLSQSPLGGLRASLRLPY